MIRFSNASGPFGHFIWAHRKMNRLRFHSFIQSIDPEPTVFIGEDRHQIIVNRHVDSDFSLHDVFHDVIQNYWYDNRRIIVMDDGSLLGRSRGIIIMICTVKGIRFEVSFLNDNIMMERGYRKLAKQFSSEISRILEAYKCY